MLIRRSALTAALGRAKHLRFEYLTNGGDGTFPDVDRLIDVCRNHLEKDIVLFVGEHEPPEQIKHVRAYYKAMGDEFKAYQINVRMPQPEVWLRFSTIKEILHVVLDVKEAESCRSIELHEHIMDVVQNAYSTDEAACDTTAIEKVAEVAAMEFCLPYATRTGYFEQVPNIDYQEIANRHGLPEPMIRRFLGESMMVQLARYEVQTGRKRKDSE